MTQTEITQRKVSQVGEEISHELGAQMIKDYQLANPADIKSFNIGRNIIEQILSQPSCAGIKFYNAYNEVGKKTLVYIGVDASGKEIIEYAAVNQLGEIGSKKAIVADRAQDNDTADSWVEKIWEMF